MKNLFKSAAKRVMLVAATVATTFSMVGLAQAWGPERPTYTIESPAPHVTFNSITNNPNYGDERTFFDVKNATNTNSGGFVDNIQVQDGQELLLRVYVHNNAADNLNTVPNGNGGFVGIAENAKVRIHLPTATDSALRANAYISASNATPAEVNDTVDFKGSSKFGLQYVPGSANIYTNAVPGGMKLNDSIVTTGAPIGYDQLNGKVPGCFQYTSIVTIKVKVVKPGIDIQKTVRKAGTTEWKEEVTVNKGDTVEYQLRVANNGQTQLDNIVVGDNLPPYMTYVPGSTKLKNSNFPNGTTASDNITTGGIEIGSAAPGGVSYILFQAKVASTFSEGCGVLTLTNVGIAKSNQTGNVQDTAIVKVDSGKVCATTTTTPPQNLPKTGAGSLIGLFAATSVAGGVAHNVISRRRATN